MHREFELKVELTKSDVKRFIGTDGAAGIGMGPATTKRLRSIYYDTPEHDLHAKGISLRVRRQDGAWVQTVKADQQLRGGVSNPVELEAPLDGPEPEVSKIGNNKIRRIVQDVVKQGGLEPVFETVVRRTTRPIKTGGSELELAVDDGEVGVHGKSQELREAELELKAGTARGLLVAADTLLGSSSLKFGTRSKAERGYRLALGKEEGGRQPEKARPAKISASDTCAKAFAEVLASAARQITVNRQALLQSDDPESAHQLRVGVRRLRSALRALRPLVGRASLCSFERSARDIARCVGELRDADVLISGIYSPTHAVAVDKVGFDQLHETLLRNRQTKRDDVRRELSGPAWTRFQLYLALWPCTLEENRALDRSVKRHARAMLAKTWRKVRELGDRLASLSPEERHAMRKTLKRLRYQAEFFAPAFDRQNAHAFIKQLETLQDVFGYLNDVHMAPRLFNLAGAAAEPARAAGYIVGRHEAEAGHVWGAAKPAWKSLKRTEQFW